MKKLRVLYLFIFVFLFFSISAQNTDFASLINKKIGYTLPNRMKIILLPIENFGNKVFTSVFFDIKPYNQRIAGELYAISILNSMYLNNGFLLYKNIISQPEAIDSTLEFISQIITNPNYSQARLNRLKANYKSLFINNSIDKQIMQLCLGKTNPYALLPDKSSLNKLSADYLKQLHKKLFQPQNITLIITGEFNPDSVKRLIYKHFAKLRNTDFSQSIYSPVKTSSHQVFFITADKPVLSFCYPLYIPFGSKLYPYFLLSQPLMNKNYRNNFNISEAYVQKMFLDYTNGIYQGFFKLKISMKNYEFLGAVSQAEVEFRKLTQPSQKEFEAAKKNTLVNIKKHFSDGFLLNMWLFLIKKFNLSETYPDYLMQKIQDISYYNFLRMYSNIFIPDTSRIIIAGRENEALCQLYYLANEYKVSLFDGDLHKYSVIQKGFSAKKVIDDYINYVHADKNLRHIVIFFDAIYYFKNSRKSLTLKGIILKRTPNYYRYKTVLIKNKDTLLHSLQITDGKNWIDSNALYSRKLSRKEFFAKVYKSYIFPELYYDTLGYEVRLKCDTVNLKRHIFKVMVSTPHNVVYYDYYDMNRKLKLRTEIATVDTIGKEHFVEVIEYDDYKPLGKNLPIMPFTIREITDDYNIILKIRNIDTEIHIPKYLFKIP